MPSRWLYFTSEYVHDVVENLPGETADFGVYQRNKRNQASVPPARSLQSYTETGDQALWAQSNNRRPQLQAELVSPLPFVHPS